MNLRLATVMIALCAAVGPTASPSERIDQFQEDLREINAILGPDGNSCKPQSEQPERLASPPERKFHPLQDDMQTILDKLNPGTSNDVPAKKAVPAPKKTKPSPPAEIRIPTPPAADAILEVNDRYEFVLIQPKPIPAIGDRFTVMDRGLPLVDIEVTSLTKAGYAIADPVATTRKKLAPGMRIVRNIAPVAPLR